MNSRARSCDSHIPAHAHPISQNIGASIGNRMAGYLKTAALAALFKVPCQFTGDMTFGGDRNDLQNSVTRGVKVRLECSPPLNHVPMEPSVRGSGWQFCRKYNQLITSMHAVVPGTLRPGQPTS